MPKHSVLNTLCVTSLKHCALSLASWLVPAPTLWLAMSRNGTMLLTYTRARLCLTDTKRECTVASAHW